MVSKLKLFSFCIVTFFGLQNTFAQANFTSNITSGCSPITVVFTNTSTGTSSYSWNFGNGNTSALVNPTETFVTPGTYTVTLTANPGATKKTAVITVFKNPTANFITNDSIGCFPHTANFTDLSIAGSGVINNWTWDFGDGGTSTLQNPSHTYTGAGNYTVTLIVKDVNGCQSVKTRVQYVKVLSSTLTATFSVSPSMGCSAPATIAFTNTSTGTGTLTYSWGFGDAGTSTSQSPSHTYGTAGTYTVTMKVTNSNGCSKTVTAPFTVLAPVVPAYTVTPTSVCPGGTFSFADQTTPAPTSWAWTFADGGTSTAQNPTHPYTTAGTYNVKLKVGYGGVCFDSVTTSITVNPFPTVSFTGDTVVHCKIPFTVDFTDASTNAAQWNWDFGDGGTSTLPNPSHQYNAAGLYTVRLIVTTASGCIDTLIKTNYVNLQPPVASYASVPDRGCVPLTSSFINSSSSLQPITNYSWNFGDGNTASIVNPSNTFTVTGTFNVVLTITNSYGCSSTVNSNVFVTIPPVPNFSLTPTNGCALSPVQFTDLTTGTVTSWQWDFGDGQTTGQQNPQHAYQDTGNFTVTLIAFNIGCPDTFIIPNAVHINPAVPRFGVGINCSNVLQRSFISSSIGADSLIWNFGDGSPLNADLSTNNSMPSHLYTGPGTYTVKLTAKNNISGCKRDTSRVIIITDLVPQFSIAPHSGCNPVNVTFTNQSSGGTINAYSWNFGEPSSGALNTSTSQGPIAHNYTTMGKKTIKLYVTDTDGCVDSIIKIDSVNVLTILPDLTIAPPPSGCDSLMVILNDASTVNPIATAWNIDFGDGKSATTPPPYTHYYPIAGTYSLTYTITNAEGTCSTTKTNFITYTKTIAAFTASSTLTCPGTNITFDNTSGNANTYSWNFGDGSPILTSLGDTTHSYAANGTYTVSLTATNTVSGCSNTLTLLNYITIDKPMPGFTTSSTAASCPPFSVTFIDTTVSVSAITNWGWSFGDGGMGLNNDTAVHIYTTPGIYDVKLITTNTAGCKDSTIKIGLIVVNGPNGTYTIQPDSGCVPLLVNFVATATSNTAIYTWTFGDGNSAVNPASVSNNYLTPGVYLPILVLEDFAGCKYSVPSTQQVKVNAYPNPNFSWSPQYPKVAEGVQFTDLSAAGNAWSWNFGDGLGTSILQNPPYSYAASGLYNVKLIVNNAGCVDSITKQITVIEELIIPNIFTPNGDGKNDTFNAAAYGISQIDIHIFDRWGVEVFKKSAPKIYWDGHTISGQEVTDGTYFYVVIATTLGGEVMDFKGFIQLVR